MPINKHGVVVVVNINRTVWYTWLCPMIFLVFFCFIFDIQNRVFSQPLAYGTTMTMLLKTFV